jgi:hypothetical protein
MNSRKYQRVEFAGCGDLAKKNCANMCIANPYFGCEVATYGEGFGCTTTFSRRFARMSLATRRTVVSSGSGRLCCKLLAALQTRNYRIRLSGVLNRCCALAHDLESISRARTLKIVLQHNRPFASVRYDAATCLELGVKQKCRPREPTRMTLAVSHDQDPERTSGDPSAVPAHGLYLGRRRHRPPYGGSDQ